MAVHFVLSSRAGSDRRGDWEGTRVVQRDEVDRRQIGALLRVPWQRANLAVNRALREAGHDDIRPAHQQVFQHLPSDGARLGELAERAQVPKQSMLYLVDYLAARGYVERVADPHQPRAARIVRTARGWEVEQVARETLRQLEDDWSERMGLERYAELCALLAYLANVIAAEPA